METFSIIKPKGVIYWWKILSQCSFFNCENKFPQVLPRKLIALSSFRRSPFVSFPRIKKKTYVDRSMMPNTTRQTPSQDKQDANGEAVGRCQAWASRGWREGKREQLVIRSHRWVSKRIHQKSAEMNTPSVSVSDGSCCWFWVFIPLLQKEHCLLSSWTLAPRRTEISCLATRFSLLDKSVWSTCTNREYITSI